MRNEKNKTKFIYVVFSFYVFCYLRFTLFRKIIFIHKKMEEQKISFNNNNFTLWQVNTKPLFIKGQLKGFKIKNTFIKEITNEIENFNGLNLDLTLKGKGSFTEFIETKAQREKREQTKTL